MSKPVKTLLNNYLKIKTDYSKMPKIPQGYDDLGDYDNTSISTYVHWTTDDYRVFVPAAPTIKSLIPGVYEMHKSDNIGLYFEKIPVRSEGLLRFPDTNSERVVKEIQKFWEREDVFESYSLTYKRGILLYGPPGCHSKGTKILMYNGDFKKIEDIVVGDEVMGPDSKPRRVLELRRGKDEMYRITPNRGESFVVNGHHVLSLQRSGKRDCATPEILNISLNDYKKLSLPSQIRYKLRRCPVDFSNTSSKIIVDPYFLGVWLGDGSEKKTEISTADKEIRDYLYQVAGNYNLHVTKRRNTNSTCCSYTISSNGGIGKNGLRNDLKKIGVFDAKHIPNEYFVASREVRLQLLAGIIDTDGGYSTASWRKNQKFKNKGYKGYFEIIQKRVDLSNQIVKLARSLGFGVTIRSCKKTIKKIGFVGEYQKISIFGDISIIPTKIPRKNALKGHANKDPLRTGISSIESLGFGDFYGFTLSGDHLYLTEDFIVHHNSGKSCTIQLIMEDVVNREGIVIKFTDPFLFTQGMRVLRQIQQDTPVVVIIEDIDSFLEMYNESEILNVLDGVNEVNKVVFLATTNYPEKLGARIVNRPSRFDKRFRIGYPSKASRRMYFEHLIGEGDENKLKQKISDLNLDLDRWVEDTDEMSVAHLKELFIQVVIIGDTYEESIETLKSMKENLEDKEFDSEIGFSGPKKSKNYYG